MYFVGINITHLQVLDSKYVVNKKEISNQGKAKYLSNLREYIEMSGKH